MRPTVPSLRLGEDLQSNSKVVGTFRAQTSLHPSNEILIQDGQKKWPAAELVYRAGADRERESVGDGASAAVQEFTEVLQTRN